MKAPAVSRCQSWPREPTISASRMVTTCVSGRRAEEDQRDQVVVPDPQELEDRERGQRRHRQRQDQAREEREVGGAVDERRLTGFARQAR